MRARNVGTACAVARCSNDTAPTHQPLLALHTHLQDVKRVSFELLHANILQCHTVCCGGQGKVWLGNAWADDGSGAAPAGQPVAIKVCRNHSGGCRYGSFDTPEGFEQAGAWRGGKWRSE